MRIRSYLRDLRGDLTITDVCAATGLARGEVSMFERGHSIPRGDQATRMVAVYGPISGWYPAGVLAVLYPDIVRCPGCDEELDPGASRRRIYHDEACRRASRSSIDPTA